MTPAHKWLKERGFVQGTGEEKDRWTHLEGETWVREMPVIPSTPWVPGEEPSEPSWQAFFRYTIGISAAGLGYSPEAALSDLLRVAGPKAAKLDASIKLISGQILR